MAPPTVSLAQLQNLALKCGITKTGTKAALRRRLTEQLLSYKPPDTSARVLSIDLGIRNLAFSLLSPPAAGFSRRVPETPRSSNVYPSLHVWRRVSLIPSASQEMAARADGVIANAADVEQEVHSTQQAGMPAGDFSPASLSVLAVQLVREQLLPLQPTHILLERQRFRSGGGTAVLEWTVRVNTLEAMLYAVLSTLRSLGRWEGVIVGIEPKRVGPFLLDDVEYDRLPEDVDGEPSHVQGAKPRKTAAQIRAENKRRKIDLVGSWLANRTGVNLISPEAEAMAKMYLSRWRKEPMRTINATGSATERLNKLDDLADSLLQGVAWFRWQTNMAQIRPWERDVLRLRG